MKPQTFNSYMALDLMSFRLPSPFLRLCSNHFQPESYFYMRKKSLRARTKFYNDKINTNCHDNEMPKKCSQLS